MPIRRSGVRSRWSEKAPHREPGSGNGCWPRHGARPNRRQSQHEVDQRASPRAALLRRLLPAVAMRLRLRLAPQVQQLVALARTVAENLLLAGEILRWTVDRGRVVP